jgi:hypothetical protein
MSFKFKIILSLLLSTFFGLTLNTAEARTFKNAYISFEMLDSWKCKLEQTEFVCRSEDPQEAKEAVIIFTAKEKGPTDSFPIYFAHLNKPISAPAKTGATLTSSVTIAPREVLVNDQKWLDSLHINSEVQNYYTRYLATIKDQIAVLITFTAHNSKYQKHASHFAETVKSLRVIASRDLHAGTSGSGIGGPGGNGVFGGVSNAIDPNSLIADESLDSNSGGQGGLFQNELFLGFLFLILAALGYVGFKIYQKKKNGKI